MKHEVASLSVRRLLNHPDFPTFELAGGSEGLDRQVSKVVRGYSVSDLQRAEPDTLVVVDRGQLRVESPETDVALRVAASQDLAGLVLDAGPGGVPLATQRLADRFTRPLVLVPDLDSVSLIGALDPVVRSPEIIGARAVEDMLMRLRSRLPGPDALVSLLSSVLGNNVALLDGEGQVLAGDAADADLYRDEIASRIAGRHPAFGTLRVGDKLLCLQPALEAPTGSANFWFLATLPTSSPLNQRAVAQVLAIATLAFSTHFSRQSLSAEQGRRERSMLLTEVLESGATPSRDTVERAVTLGWQLSGWHTAVHIASTGDDDASLARSIVLAIETALRQRGLGISLIDVPDGWVGWATEELEPGPSETTSLTRSVRHALIDVARGLPHASISAGVGRPHHGTAGIAESLEEAQQACLLARTSDMSVAVEHIDALNVKALMTRWYSSNAVRETAAHLLEPLMDADPSGELLRTLRTFLDCESSATTTAAVLGIHRNTVVQRMARIRATLPLDLDRPDDRLLAHLATRGADID